LFWEGQQAGEIRLAEEKPCGEASVPPFIAGGFRHFQGGSLARVHAGGVDEGFRLGGNQGGVHGRGWLLQALTATAGRDSKKFTLFPISTPCFDCCPEKLRRNPDVPLEIPYHPRIIAHMIPAPLARFSLSLALLTALALPLAGQEASPPPAPPPPGSKTPIPDDVLGDEHVREEFGVNEFTTPSIRKLFDMLSKVGKLKYDELKRPFTDKTPADRVIVSLGLGTLIADGFLIVQTEKVDEMEFVGRAMIKYGKALGAGGRMNKHTQSLFEHSLRGEWDDLKEELARTQADVEAEMVMLRDVDIAHLISLGGWLRALEMSTKTIAMDYAEEKTRQLTRRDILEYYLSSLDSLHPSLLKNQNLIDLRKGIEEMMPMVDVPEGKALTHDEIKKLSEKASALSHIITDKMKG
jgi:hypothetical protein